MNAIQKMIISHAKKSIKIADEIIKIELKKEKLLKKANDAELKLQYKFHQIDLKNGEHESSDFAKLNPFKKVRLEGVSRRRPFLHPRRNGRCRALPTTLPRQ